MVLIEQIDMRATAESLYRKIRSGMADGNPITVLHIGEKQSVVVSGALSEPAHVSVLTIGSHKTALDFFKHTPPTPGEIENAIVVVEDEISKVRAITTTDATLFTSDSAIREIARISGTATPQLLSIDLVEQTFDLLAALAQGRPAVSAGIPSDNTFAATLLILREFMHHLRFASITITG